MSRPLLSYIVVTFNQEKYIREAVESALAQTYSPLEIIISDDKSSDRTVEIVKEVIAAYKGPHFVRLNCNEENIGIGKSITKLMGMCRGELVVGQAGDDLAMPERTETIYQAWEASGRKATSIFTSYITITSDGKEVGVGGTRGEESNSAKYRKQEGSVFKFLFDKWPVVVGCTHAWSPQLFKFFGPLNSDLEDLVLSFRSLSYGQMLYVHSPVLKYRRHDSNVSFFADWDDTRSFEHREKRLLWVNKKTVDAYDNMLTDIETLFSNKKISEAERKSLRDEAIRVRAKIATELLMMTGNYLDKIGAVVGAAFRGDIHCAAKSSARLMPLPMYRWFYIYRAKRNARKQPNTV
jgi:glycosyltransferase involved in cell wall biosynthesis